jgi:hypothetical protein
VFAPAVLCNTFKWVVRSPRFRKQAPSLNGSGFSSHCSPDDSVDCKLDIHCAQCDKIVLACGLLLGRRWLSTPATGWHELCASIGDLQASGRELCHLCCRLWNFVESNLRTRYLDEDRELQRKLKNLLQHENHWIDLPSFAVASDISKSMKIRLKIWDGKPAQ